jgi:hypothetical protein
MNALSELVATKTHLPLYDLRDMLFKNVSIRCPSAHVSLKRRASSGLPKGLFVGIRVILLLSGGLGVLLLHKQGTACNNSIFGDPSPGTAKTWYYQ